MRRLTLATILALSAPAQAESTAADPSDATAAASSSWHLDLEVDPVAYALSGYSVHVGAGWKRLRLDLGAFGLDLPRFVHGNDGFSSSVNGFGARLQYFPLAEQAGVFAGVGAQLDRQHIYLDGTRLSALQTNWSAGVQAGWRFTIGPHFYVTPWVWLSYTFDSADVTLAGHTYKATPLTIYPFVHVGYRFR